MIVWICDECFAARFPDPVTFTMVHGRYGTCHWCGARLGNRKIDENAQGDPSHAA